MKFLLLTLALTLGLMLATPATAAEIVTPDKLNSFPSGTGQSDVYTGGDNVTVDHPVAGDLTIFGGSVLVNSAVEQSLFVAGGTVTVRSGIGRHARIAGGTVTITGHIQGDLLVAGGTVTLAKDAVVDGDLLAAGGTIVIDGVVKGQVRVGSAELTIKGQTGNVSAWVNKLTITATAKVTGDVSYHAPETASIATDSVTGKVDFQKVNQKMPTPLRGFASVFNLLGLLGLMILAWLTIRLFPRSTASVVRFSQKKVWLSLGLGLATVIIIPMVIFVLMISIVGWPIGLAILLLWLLALLVGSIKGRIIFGSWLIRLLTKSDTHFLDYQTVLVGVLGLAIIGLIPVVGWLIGALFFLIGLGSEVSHWLKFKDDLTIDTQPASSPSTVHHHHSGQ